MLTEEIIAQIKPFGKTAYVARKKSLLIPSREPSSNELNLSFIQNGNKVFLDKPVSLLGAVSHQLTHETLPSYNNEDFLPFMQITSENLPFFSEFFGSATMISVYLPEVIIDREEGVLPVIKRYDDLEALIKLKMPADMKLLSEIYLIEWEKVIDYPHFHHRQYFYPEELCNALNEAYENFEAEFEEKYGDIPDDSNFDYHKRFPHFEGTKIGGYPTEVQCGPEVWMKYDGVDQREAPKYWNFVMQILDDDFGNNVIVLGDGGILYVMKDARCQEWYFDHEFY